MVLAQADQFDEHFREESAGSKNFYKRIEFLRQRYADYRKDQVAEDRFFLIRIRLAEAGPDNKDQPGTSTPRQRSVALYFQKKDLYLRGWTIDDDPHEDCFMAAWDTKEDFTKPNPRSLLPGGGTGYKGKEPKKGEGGYISLRYPNTGTPQDSISKDAFFKHASILHDYLYRLKNIRKPKPEDIEKGRKAAEDALHSLARMTSEMARFDAYCQELSHQPYQPYSGEDRWELGMDLNTRPTSRFNWGSNSKPDMRMPELHWALVTWSKCSQKANGGAAKLEYLNKDKVQVTVTQQMAAEMLGDGSRWRS